MVQALFAFLLLAGVAFSAPARAAEDARIEARSLQIELNRLEQNDSACRITFVTTNGLGASLDDLAVELVLFDKGGLVSRMTAAGFGAMPSGKTLVKRFDMPNLPCADVSRILVNGVAACRGEGLAVGACGQALSTANRTGIAFGR